MPVVGATLYATPPAHVPTFWVFEGGVIRSQDANARAIWGILCISNSRGRTPHDTTKLVGLGNAGPGCSFKHVFGRDGYSTHITISVIKGVFKQV